MGRATSVIAVVLLLSLGWKAWRPSPVDEVRRTAVGGMHRHAEATPWDPSKGSARERPVLEFLKHASIDDQIRMDIALHDKAILRRTFSQDGLRFLAEDSRFKAELRQALAAGVSAEEHGRFVGHLRRNQSIHGYYLGKPESSKTGTHEWHRAWSAVYEGWIAELAKRSQGT